MSETLRGEEAALVAVQSALAYRPGVLAGARALSHFGEHSIGWVAVAVLGAVLQPRRQPLYQDGEEDDVVDAENDLEQRQRDERQPDVRIGDQRTGTPLRQVIKRRLLHGREHVFGGQPEVERDGAGDVD